LRRDALAALGALAAMACGGRGPQVGRAASPFGGEPLKLDPIVDLVPAAALVWLVEARPRALFASRVVGDAVSVVAPGARFDAFARRHGGVDVRRAEELVVADYGRSTLTVARVAFEPPRVEAAFVARAETVGGRSSDRGVTRLWGSVHGRREEIALLQNDALVVASGESMGRGAETGAGGAGDVGPLRAAIYFAQGRLRRSLPALRAEPLASAAALTRGAPLRMFAPGPFEGEWTRGLAGLLRATTALAVAAEPASGPPRAAIRARLLLLGGWGADAPSAAERLRSAFGVVALDPLGRLIGMDRPIDGPTVLGEPEALTLDVTLDATALSHGAHAASGASVDEIMAY
jgi:hypothetical protein